MPEENQNQNSQNYSEEEQNQGQNESHTAQDQAGNPPSWRETLPPELKAEKTFEKFKDVASLAKSYLKAEKAISKKDFILPTEKSTPEEWDNFYKAIGRPENPDGYKLNNEGVTIDENLNKFALSMFHEAGLTNKQADLINSKWNEMQKSNAAQNEKIRAKVTADFKKEWGNNFDTNLKKADDAGHRVFGKSFMDALMATGMNNHPDVIKGLHKLSNIIGEHSFITGNSNRTAQQGVTWEKLLSMKADPKYWDPSRRDPAFVKEVEAANIEYAESKGA